MNNRIKELAERCESGGTWEDRTTTFDKEKFAQLIIWECMSLCDEQKARYFGYRIAASDFVDKNMWAQSESACDTIRHGIQKHFGFTE